MYLGFLASYASGVALIIQISKVLSLFRFGFSIRYRVSIRFRFRFFKYSFYSRVLVFLVLLYTKLKLLLSLGWCSSQGRFIGFSRDSRSLVNISRIWQSSQVSRIQWIPQVQGRYQQKFQTSRSQWIFQILVQD